MFNEIIAQNAQKRKHNAEELDNKNAKISRKEVEVLKQEDDYNNRRKPFAFPKRKTGNDDCRCHKNCFQSISDDEKHIIINYVNHFDCKYERDCYLQSLISTTENGKMRKRKFKRPIHNFKVSINGIQKNVCKNTYLSVHGISRKIVRRLTTTLSAGLKPFDKRSLNGQHNMIPSDISLLVQEHILSMVENSIDSSIQLFSGKLNLKKMTEMFNEKWPKSKVKYGSYRKIFKENFNITSTGGFVKKSGLENLKNYTSNDSIKSKENKLEFNETLSITEVKGIISSKSKANENTNISHTINLDKITQKPKKFYIKLNLQKKNRKKTII